MNIIELGSIVKIVKGKKATSVFDIQKEGSVRFIQIDDLRNDNNLKFTDEKGVFAKPDDVIIAWDGANAGTIGYGLEGVIGSTLAKLEIHNGEVYPKFLGRFLQSKSRHLRDGCTGATIPHISKQVLTNLQVPIPSFEEQKRIAKRFDEADALRQKRRRAINLLEEYLKSVFLEMFGDPLINDMKWPLQPLANIAKLERGRFSPRPRNDPSYFNGIYPFIQTGDIANCNHRLNKYSQTLNERGIKVSKQFVKGDIVIAIVGATIGATAILEIDVYATDSIICIKAFETVADAIYLEYNLRFWREPLLRGAPEAARPNINLAILNRLNIILPPIEAQIKFSHIAKKVEALKRKMLAQTEELENHFQALMQKAFNGKL